MSLSTTVATLSRPGVKSALAHAGRALSSKRVIGESGCGLVRATLGGDGRVISLSVSPALGKETTNGQGIADHITVAINRAHEQLREATKQAVQRELPPNVELSMIMRAIP